MVFPINRVGAVRTNNVPQRPPAFPELLDMDKTTMPRIHELALQGKLNFLYYPTRGQLSRYHFIAMGHTRAPQEKPVVFIGQVPKGMPSEIVAWVVDTILKKYATEWMIVGRKKGCQSLWLEREEDLGPLLKLNRTVMWDLCGIWYCGAEDPIDRGIQVSDLADYIDKTPQEGRQVDLRLSGHPMVIEKVRGPGDAPPPRLAAHSGAPIPQSKDGQFVPPPMPPYIKNRQEAEMARLPESRRDGDEQDPDASTLNPAAKPFNPTQHQVVQKPDGAGQQDVGRAMLTKRKDVLSQLLRNPRLNDERKSLYRAQLDEVHAKLAELNRKDYTETT